MSFPQFKYGHSNLLSFSLQLIRNTVFSNHIPIATVILIHTSLRGNSEDCNSMILCAISTSNGWQYFGANPTMSNDLFRRGKKTASKKYDTQRQRGQLKVHLKQQRKTKKIESQRPYTATFNPLFKGNPTFGSK